MAYGWRALQGVLTTIRQERQDEDARRPVACPNDGEPLKVSIHGVVYCPYDGWTPGEVR